jgi:hypothetical protein
VVGQHCGGRGWAVCGRCGARWRRGAVTSKVARAETAVTLEGITAVDHPMVRGKAAEAAGGGALFEELAPLRPEPLL